MRHAWLRSHGVISGKASKLARALLLSGSQPLYFRGRHDATAEARRTSWRQLLFHHVRNDDAWNQEQPLLGIWHARERLLRNKARHNSKDPPGWADGDTWRRTAGGKIVCLIYVIPKWLFTIFFTVRTNQRFVVPSDRDLLLTQALKTLRTAEFAPFVVFISAPDVPATSLQEVRSRYECFETRACQTYRTANSESSPGGISWNWMSVKLTPPDVVELRFHVLTMDWACYCLVNVQ